MERSFLFPFHICSHTRLTTVGMFLIIGSLEFTSDRLTISVSATCSSWACDSPSSLACFPVKLILMPTHRDNPMGIGRVRTELLHQFRLDYPALLSGLAPRP